MTLLFKEMGTCAFPSYGYKWTVAGDFQAESLVGSLLASWGHPRSLARHQENGAHQPCRASGKLTQGGQLACYGREPELGSGFTWVL